MKKKNQFPAHRRSHSPVSLVSLVGAGAGDAGLITVRALERIRQADVIVYDYLANEELLRHARAGARILYAGKKAGHHELTQAQTNALLLKLARQGQRVVRLKGGDPFVFGRGGEEAEELAKARIPFEIVPGVTSAIAVPAYAGIPVTHRDFASGVTFVTGHEDPTKSESSVDWSALAQSKTTLVILMGVGRLRQIAQALVEGGLPSQTPTAVIQWGTTSRQRTAVAPLSKIADEVIRQKISPPAVTIIGKVVSLRKTLNWFETRPLFGKRVVVTRAREQASDLSEKLRALGADVLELPTIKIVPPKNPASLRKAAREAATYDWLVFTSVNGVDAFFDSVPDVRSIGSAKIAVIGPATAERVRQRGLAVALQPEEFIAEQLVEAFKPQAVKKKRILLARADIAREALAVGLRKLGAEVTEVVAYRTVRTPEEGLGRKLQNEGADWVTFTSSSTVENFCAALNVKRLLKKHPKIRFASIGPITSQTARRNGLSITAEAKTFTIQGLIQALTHASRSRRK